MCQAQSGEGTQLEHTFTEVGNYLVTLQGHSPDYDPYGQDASLFDINNDGWLLR